VASCAGKCTRRGRSRALQALTENGFTFGSGEIVAQEGTRLDSRLYIAQAPCTGLAVVAEVVVVVVVVVVALVAVLLVVVHISVSRGGPGKTTQVHLHFSIRGVGPWKTAQVRFSACSALRKSESGTGQTHDIHRELEPLNVVVHSSTNGGHDDPWKT